MAKKTKQVKKTPRLTKGPAYPEPDTITLKDLRAKAKKARQKEIKLRKQLRDIASRNYGEVNRASDVYIEHVRAKADAIELEDQASGRRKPSKISDKEFRKQKRTGEAAVQNVRPRRPVDRQNSLFHRATYKQLRTEKPDKKVPEFLMTTIREPKKVENPKRMGKLRSEFRQEQERILREEAAYEKAKNKRDPKLLKKAARARTKQGRRR